MKRNIRGSPPLTRHSVATAHTPPHIRHLTLPQYLIEESIITRAINELLKFVGEMAFNDLLRKTHSPRELVDGLSENIRRIEEWCKIRAMSGSILQLAHLTVRMFFSHL